MWVVIHFVLILLLAAAGIAAPWVGPILNLQPPSTGAFTGALISSAAVMLGTLLVRQQTRGDKKSADSERRNSIKTLVAAELVNVAAGYIQLRETMNAAMKTLSSGGSISMLAGLSSNMPRSMPFTSALGTELLLLSPQEIDVLSTLASNVALTQKQLEEISTAPGSVGLLSVTPVSQGVAHDMNLLAQAFDHIAPSRKLSISGKSPELAAALLRRLATEAT